MSSSLDIKTPPTYKQLDPPPRLMCGPGPSNAHPRVYNAMATPQVGHMDPHFLELMEETKGLLRYVWQTKNNFTIPVSGTGSASWEACVANTIFKGDKVLVAQNGYFGVRMVDMCERYGAEIAVVKAPWGQPFTLDSLKAAFDEHKPDVFFIVHAETSTGVRQPMEGISDLCKAHNCLLMLDTVTSISGLPVYLDRWGVDICYAGGQKCLSCPPGIAPLSFSEAAVKKMLSREGKTPNWYLDMSLIQKYIVMPAGAPRSYHHTAPISMVYAFRESLQLTAEEGLEARWARHKEVAEFFWAGLEKIGLSCLVDIEYRLPSLTTVKIPEGIDGGAVVKFLRENYNLEIGGGLGDLKGQVWRVGLMGYNSRKEVAMTVLAGLRDALEAQGYKA